MKWNGTVSQCENTRMASRFAAENSAQTTSTQATRHGQLKLPRARAARAVARRLATRVKASPAGSECHRPAATGAAASRGVTFSGAATGDGSGPRARVGVCWRSRSHPAIPSLRGELVSLTTHRLDQVETEFRAEAAD